jgi:hypothetical protein
MKQKNMLRAGTAAAIVALVGVIGYFLQRNSGKKPARKAPQTPLNNPGDQSEFTTAPSVSELG